MKDLIQPFEAQQLKSLGFDDACVAYRWDPTYKVVGDTEPNCERIHWTPLHIQDHNLLPTRISVPTYGQAFKWLMVKYSISFHIRDYYYNKDDWKKYGRGFQIIIEGIQQCTETGSSSSVDLYFQYEEAEQACLEKLIKIVK